jgi:hypothetical protein
MFDKMVFKALKKRVDPYLAPGEELLSVTGVQASGMMGMKYFLGGGEVGLAIRGAMRDSKGRDSEASSADEGGVDLPSLNMHLAITSRRLLIFKFGSGKSANPKDLLMDVPIDEVDSIEVGRKGGMKPVTLTVRGESFELEARLAENTDRLISAFEQTRQHE